MYKHSIRVDRRKCVGCTSCIKTCPTEAIRVQDGKAKILDDKCIDCGRCITYCHHGATVSITTPVSAMSEYKYTIAITSSALYAQFRTLQSPATVYQALYEYGFSAVYEEAKAAEILAEATRKYLKTSDAVYPVISTNCPVIPRLVAALYPNLIDNLSPFLPSSEIAARIARKEFLETTGADPGDVGVFYISPCAAMMSHVKNPVGTDHSDIDGVFTVRDFYASLIQKMGKCPEYPNNIVHPSGAYGLSAAVVGGLSSAIGIEHYLAVDGVHAIAQCLDEIEGERLINLQFLEAAACNGGCVGGPLNFENQFVAKNRNRRIANSQPRMDPSLDEHVQQYIDSDLIRYSSRLEAQNIMQLSDNVVEAMRMMDRMEEINRSLPGLDCGSCGSPTCRTLAEDIVKGYAVEMDCIFKLRDKVRLMAQEMVDLANAKRRG